VADDTKRVLAIIAKLSRLDVPIEADTSVLTSGILDSFAMTELLAAIERDFGRKIALDEIGADNFDTPRQIASFLKSSR